VIKRLINNNFLNERPTQSIAAAAFIISLAGIASRILGLIRDRILAGQFGAGDTLDAYYAAFRIPDLIYNLIIVGALSAAFIPVFTELIAKDNEEEAWKLSSGVLSLLVVVVGALSVFFAIFAPQLMKLITPGFTGEKMELTVVLTRIMFLSPFLLGISGIFGGVLVSFKKFLIYSLAPVFYNVGIIIGAVYFVKFWGPIGLAWGVALGAGLHMLIQYPSVKHSGFHFYPIFSDIFKNQKIRKVLKLMLPRTLTVAANQINLTIVPLFASNLAAGSLTAFYLANNIQSAPLGLFGISFAIAVFPSLSSLAAQKKGAEFINTFSRTFRQILFFIIPFSVFIYVLRAQTVRLALGSGKFDWNDTIMTFQILGLLTIGLFAQSLMQLLTRAFYALQNTKTPLYTVLISEIINIILIFIFIGKYGILGIAFALSVSSIINMILLLFFLRRKISRIDGKTILDSTLRILAASLIGGGVAQIMKYLVGSQGELDTFFAVFRQFVIAGLFGAGAFFLASYYLRIKEFFQFKEALTRKLFRVKKTISEDTGEVTGI
jgi:putative peptidoglycan lipid II flippase